MATIIKNFTPAPTCWQCRFLTEAEWLCLAANRHIYKSDNPKPKWCPIEEWPKGTWEYIGLKDEYGFCEHFVCSRCNMAQTDPWQYCGNCGAEMEPFTGKRVSEE